MRVLILLLTLLSFVPAAVSQDRHTARSMVISRYGIVATTHVQASQAGAQILRKGGSAVDAAIAANAVLGMTEPMMNGIGGDLFAIYLDAESGETYRLKSRGWAPHGGPLRDIQAKRARKKALREIDSPNVPRAA